MLDQVQKDVSLKFTFTKFILSYKGQPCWIFTDML